MYLHICLQVHIQSITWLAFSHTHISIEVFYVCTCTCGAWITRNLCIIQSESYILRFPSLFPDLHLNWSQLSATEPGQLVVNYSQLCISQTLISRIIAYVKGLHKVPLQWNLVIKRSDITKPSYNKVILLVPALYISLYFYPDIMRNLI